MLPTSGVNARELTREQHARGRATNTGQVFDIIATRGLALPTRVDKGRARHLALKEFHFFFPSPER